MQLISYLQEAADIPLADLKAAVKKDKRVNKIFSKNLQLDEIPDIKEFVNTLRFYILNNRHVLAHVKMRNAASSRVSDFWFRNARQIRPENLDQKGLDELQEAITDLFRDITSTTNATYSNDTAESLWGWINQYKGFRGTLSYQAIRELKALPSIRPDKPVILYRGVLFSEASLKEKSDYNGGMTVGAGLKFLRSIREGKRVADVEYDQPTVWYRSKDLAMDEAFNGEETWRSERKSIRGELAFVISMIADPKHIIVDTSMMPKVKPEKPAVVVDSGKYTTRIVHKFTKDGEVDPLASATENSEAASILENLQVFAHIFKLPFAVPLSDTMSRGGWNTNRVEEFKTLSDPSAKSKIVKAMQNLIDYYNEHLKDIPKNELNELTGHPSLGKAAQAAMEITDAMNEKHPHPTKRDERYSGTRQLNVPRHEMTADEIWSGNRYSSFRGTIPILKMSEKTPRFRDWSTWSPIVSLMHFSGMPVVKELEKKAGKVQHGEVLKLIDAFFDTIGEPKPATQGAAVDRMMELISEFERNAGMLTKLGHVRELLDRLKD